MQKQSQARIFLADNYQHRQTNEYRNISVFNDDAPTFNNLTAVNDITLAESKTVELNPESALLVLPLVGSLRINMDGKNGVLECGELLLANNVRSLTVENPFTQYLVNFLAIEIAQPLGETAISHQYPFDLNSNTNDLLTVYSKSSMCFVLGKFEMRRETIYYPQNRNSTCFCFVIQGSFEIEGRLLHERDALTIWDTSELEVESLGKESILLLIEQNNLSENPIKLINKKFYYEKTYR